jgi:hypothetical protein
MKTLGRCLLAAVLVGASARSASAQQVVAEPEVEASKKLGVGYKIGNGLGFVGADVIIVPVEHLSLDLQGNYLSYSSGSVSASGYGLALKGHSTRPGRGRTRPA